MVSKVSVSIRVSYMVRIDDPGYVSVPYEHKDFEGAFRATFRNLQIALREFDSCLSTKGVEKIFD